MTETTPDELEDGHEADDETAGDDEQADEQTDAGDGASSSS